MERFINPSIGNHTIAMARTGAYDLDKSERKDNSFKHFIIILLVVLALLVLIYLVLAFGLSNTESDKENYDKLSGDITRNRTVKPQMSVEFEGEREDISDNKSEKIRVHPIQHESEKEYSNEYFEHSTTKVLPPKTVTTVREDMVFHNRLVPENSKGLLSETDTTEQETIPSTTEMYSTVNPAKFYDTVILGSETYGSAPSTTDSYSTGTAQSTSFTYDQQDLLVNSSTSQDSYEFSIKTAGTTEIYSTVQSTKSINMYGRNTSITELIKDSSTTPNTTRTMGGTEASEILPTTTMGGTEASEILPTTTADPGNGTAQSTSFTYEQQDPLVNSATSQDSYEFSTKTAGTTEIYSTVQSTNAINMYGRNTSITESIEDSSTTPNTTRTMGGTEATEILPTTTMGGTEASEILPTTTMGGTEASEILPTTTADPGNGTAQSTSFTYEQQDPLVNSATSQDSYEFSTKTAGTTEIYSTVQSTNSINMYGRNTSITESIEDSSTTPNTTRTIGGTEATEILPTTTMGGTEASEILPTTTMGGTEASEILPTTTADPGNGTAQSTSFTYEQQDPLVNSATSQDSYEFSTKTAGTTEIYSTVQSTNSINMYGRNTSITESIEDSSTTPNTTRTMGGTEASEILPTTTMGGTEASEILPTTTADPGNGTAQSTSFTYDQQDPLVNSATSEDSYEFSTKTAGTTEIYSTAQSTNSINMYGRNTSITESIENSSTTPSTTTIMEILSSGIFSNTQPWKSLIKNSNVNVLSKVCVDPVCKKVSSKWLATMNHNENLNPCEDFYNFACGEPSIVESEQDALFRTISKDLVRKAKGNLKKSKYSQIFTDFYKDCKEYKNDFIMKDTLNSLNSIENKTMTDIFIELILKQAMPFFDVGLKVNNSQTFGYELTLPEISSLRTSLSKWSLMEQMEQECIVEVTDKIEDSMYFNETLERDIHNCVKNNTNSYINKFASEMKKMRDLFDDETLSLSFENHSDGLQSLMDELQEILLKNYNSSTVKNREMKRETIALREMDRQYKCRDLNWLQVFAGITKNANITGDTIIEIYFPDYMKKVLDVFDKEQNIQGILNLWYNIQLFRNTRFESNDHRSTYCVKLTSQLLPEISVALLNENSASEISQGPLEIYYELVEKLFQRLKRRFRKSLSQVNMHTDLVQILQSRLDEIELRNNMSNKLETNSLLARAYGNWSDTANKPYHQKVTILLENYRKNVFSLVGQKYTSDVLADILLLYFVDPFDTQPKTFPPSRHVVFQPAFVHGMSKKLPEYIELATKGFRLGEQISKHFENDDSNKESNDTKKQLNRTFDAASLDLIGGIEYYFDNNQNDAENIRCFGNCFNTAEIFEHNVAFRLVTDLLEDLKDRTVLPFMDEPLSPEKYFVSFIAHEFCKRQTIVDYVAELFRGRKLPAPVKIRNMMRNSDFFRKLYNCKRNQYVNQFPYNIPSPNSSLNNSN